ncbi:MAG: hypothetical protein N3A69_05510 [Leptospiraceae bacterium]|nr:hypothetical protein [Leptospiraceae bacterium]
MKTFIILWTLSISFLYAENRCAKLKTEAECTKDRNCVWDIESCISTFKFVQKTSNSSFGNRTYDPTSNSQSRSLTKGIQDPRARRPKQNPPQKNEATPASNP